MQHSLALFVIGLKLLTLPEAMPLKILMIQPSYAHIHSHFTFALNLAKFLAENDGHEVHLLVPIKDEIDKMTDQNDEKRLNVRYFQSTTQHDQMPAKGCDKKNGQPPKEMTYFEIANNLPLMDELSAEKFDVGIAEAFVMSEYSLTIFHFLRIPVTMATNTMPITPHQFYLLGILSKMAPGNVPASSGPPMHPANHTDDKGKNSGIIIGDHRPKQLKRRANEIWTNIVDRTMEAIRRHIEMDPIYQKLAEEEYEFDVFPGLDEMFRKTRFFLVNSQPEVDFDNYRSVNGNEKVKFIGGFNLSPNVPPIESKIYERLQNKKGIVLVSFGTVLDTTKTAFPNFDVIEVIEVLKCAIEKFPNFLFVWKLSKDDPKIKEISDELPHVYATDWADQLAILGNVKTKAFVSHCGMNSVLEGIYYGVPMVCVPFFGDQYYNSESLARQRIGLVVDREQAKETLQQQLTVALAKALGLYDSDSSEYEIDFDKLKSTSALIQHRNITNVISEKIRVIEDELGTNDQFKDLSLISKLLISGATPYESGWPATII